MTDISLYLGAGFFILLISSFYLMGCRSNPINPVTPTTPIDYSFMMGISPNYTLLGATDYKSHIDMVAKYRGNVLRVFGFAGWGDSPSSYAYKPCLGNDLSQLDPNYVQKVKDFVTYANSKGIIVIFSLFHNNGDPYSWITHTNGEHQIGYIKALVNVCKSKAVIWEPLNEDVDSGFSNFVQNNIRLLDPQAKTCFYSGDGGTYRIEHTVNKSYIGNHRIQSNDKSNYPSYLNAGDYFNITKQCKEQGGPGVEWLVYWSNQGTGDTAQQWESHYQDMLNLIKQLR